MPLAHAHVSTLRGWRLLLASATTGGASLLPPQPTRAILNGEAEADEAGQIASENEMLRLRLHALKDAMAEDLQFSYVVVKGYISGAENVYMETMGVDEAKTYCNSNSRCKGFTFSGPSERPEDEVTVAFKAGSKVVHDANWVSFVKESSMFGALQGAAKLDEAHSPAVISHGLTFESICIVFALALSVVFICRRRCGTPPLRTASGGLNSIALARS